MRCAATGPWVAAEQGVGFSSRHREGQGKGVAAEHVDVREAKRRQAGHVRGVHLDALGAELSEGRVHVDRVSEHNDVDHEAERAELVLLALAVALATCPACLEDGTRQPVAALVPVELAEDAATEPLVAGVFQ